MSTLEWFLFIALLFSVVLGISLGYRNRKHRHTWTMWTRVWDDDRLELTQDQERVCAGCGLREFKAYIDPSSLAPKMCRPEVGSSEHDWGRWQPQKYRYPGGRVVDGQKRTCRVCGLDEDKHP